LFDVTKDGCLLGRAEQGSGNFVLHSERSGSTLWAVVHCSLQIATTSLLAQGNNFLGVFALGWPDSTNDGCKLGCVDGCDDGTTEGIKDDGPLGWLDGTNDGSLLG